MEWQEEFLRLRRRIALEELRIFLYLTLVTRRQNIFLNRLAVRQACWDSPLPGFLDKYKVLQLSMFALLSALRWCDFTYSRLARGDVMRRFRWENAQREDFLKGTVLQGSLLILSLSRSFTCSSIFVRTFRISSARKVVLFAISRIFWVGRLSAWNALLIFETTFWKSLLETSARGKRAISSLRSLLRSSTFDRTTGSRQSMQSEERMA